MADFLEDLVRRLFKIKTDEPPAFGVGGQGLAGHKARAPGLAEDEAAPGLDPAAGVDQTP